MPVFDDAALEARFANLDANAVIDLCTSLADYGEAGGLSPELMMQVGHYAEVRYGDEREVLFAVGRMYLAGGETLRAKGALVQSLRLGMDERVVAPVLDEVLGLLRDPRSVEEVLREPPEAPPPAKTSGVLRPATAGARKPGPRAVSAPAQRSTTTSLNALKAAAARAAAMRTTSIADRRARPGLPAEARRETARHRPVEEPHGRRHAAALRAPEEDPERREPRTERRAVRRSEPQGEPTSTRRRGVPPAHGVRPNRIRMLEPDDPRRRLDPYEIIGEIASGGMATVFLGRLEGHGGFSRLVAVKQLHAHLATEEQFVQMFLDEARLAAAIHHPHVISILEVGMSKAGYFLVMEFVEGDTLSGLTARTHQRGVLLPARASVRIVLDALAGLHAAHQLTDADGKPLGLVHRDVTPQNILVGVDGSARITDFGVARAASRLAITRPQQVKGKVGYLSPEQAQAQDVDRRSDLFSMGIVLWEALTGRPLFAGDTDAVTLSSLLAAPIPSVRRFVHDVPAAIDDVCRRALHRDRSRRFRTAAEMAEALEQAAHAEGFGGAASARELGKLVAATMGSDLTAQREAIRLAPRVVGVGEEGLRGPTSNRDGALSARARLAARVPGAVVPAPTEEGAPAATNRASMSQPPPSGRRVASVPPRTSTLASRLGPIEADAAAATAPTAEAPAPASAPKPAAPEPAAGGDPEGKPSAELGSARNIALVVLLVIAATSLLWGRVAYRAFRGLPADVASAPPGKPRPTEAVPVPKPQQPQRAWDEGDWGIDAGPLPADER